jgi:transposase
VHDTTEKTWRHLDFFQHPAFFTARVPRITCTKCGVRQVGVPWARKGSGFGIAIRALRSGSPCFGPHQGRQAHDCS